MVKDGQSFCANCGAAVTPPAQPAPQPAVLQAQPPQPVYYQPVQQVPSAVPDAPAKRSKGLAIAGFILGISSVAFCFIIFVNFISIFTGLPGAILSILGLVKKNGKLKVLAVIGLILSIFGLFVSGLIWASFWSKDAYDLAESLFSWLY